MKLFYLNREEDETGKSGIGGRIAQGVQFDDSTVAIRWISETPSTILYNNIAAATQVHGHNGKTVVEWETDWRAKYQDLKKKLSELSEDNGDK